MVTALKVSSTPLYEQRLQRARRDRRVGEHERQHGRHVGRDHAGALGHAVDGDFCLAEFHGRCRDLCKGVGGHDRFSRQPSIRPARRFSQRAEHTVEFGGVERFADHRRWKPENTSLERHPSAMAAMPAVSVVACRPVLPVKALALAGIHHQRAGKPSLGRSAAFRLARHQSTGGEGALRFGEDAGHRRALVHDREQHVGAALVADTPRPAVCELTPEIAGMSGTLVGASGETDVDIGQNPKTG